MGQTNPSFPIICGLGLINTLWIVCLEIVFTGFLHPFHIFVGMVITIITMGIWSASYLVLHPPKWMQDHWEECELRQTARRILEKRQQEELEKIVGQLRETSKNE